MRNTFREYEEYIMRILKIKKIVFTIDIRKEYGISASYALEIFQRLVKEGKVIQHSSGRAYYYTLA
jgi:Mn-dependent DtxR family transcriptional regulator